VASHCDLARPNAREDACTTALATRLL